MTSCIRKDGNPTSDCGIVTVADYQSSCHRLDAEAVIYNHIYTLQFIATKHVTCDSFVMFGDKGKFMRTSSCNFPFLSLVWSEISDSACSLN